LCRCNRRRGYRPREETVTRADCNAVAVIRGLVIGQAVADADDGFRVVAIDPDLNTVEIEDSGGTVLTDTIDHFTASHLPRPASTTP
jgi:hypothetical protein